MSFIGYFSWFSRFSFFSFHCSANGVAAKFLHFKISDLQNSQLIFDQTALQVVEMVNAGSV